MAEVEQNVVIDRGVLICVLEELRNIVRELEGFYTEQSRPWGEGEVELY